MDDCRPWVWTAGVLTREGLRPDPRYWCLFSTRFTTIHDADEPTPFFEFCPPHKDRKNGGSNFGRIACFPSTNLHVKSRNGYYFIRSQPQRHTQGALPFKVRPSGTGPTMYKVTLPFKMKPSFGAHNSYTVTIPQERSIPMRVCISLNFAEWKLRSTHTRKGNTGVPTKPWPKSGGGGSKERSLPCPLLSSLTNTTYSGRNSIEPSGLVQTNPDFSWIHNAVLVLIEINPQNSPPLSIGIIPLQISAASVFSFQVCFSSVLFSASKFSTTL